LHGLAGTTFCVQGQKIWLIQYNIVLRQQQQITNVRTEQRMFNMFKCEGWQRILRQTQHIDTSKISKIYLYVMPDVVVFRVQRIKCYVL